MRAYDGAIQPGRAFEYPLGQRLLGDALSQARCTMAGSLLLTAELFHRCSGRKGGCGDGNWSRLPAEAPPSHPNRHKRNSRQRFNGMRRATSDYCQNGSRALNPPHTLFDWEDRNGA
jgi:hypothetical protein